MRFALFFVAFLWSAEISAQGLRVRLDSCEGISTLHAHRVDPILGKLHWKDVVLVAEDTALFNFQLREGEAWALESPPYRWDLETRENEPHIAVLTCPNGVPMRLRNVFGKVSWEQPDGSPSDHPAGVLNRLELEVFQAVNALEYDILSASGAVGSRASLVEDSLWVLADERMQERFGAAAAALSAPWAEDVVLEERLTWAKSTGVSYAELQGMLKDHLRRSDRSACELLHSTAFVHSVQIALRKWWESLDEEAFEEALRSMDMASVQSAMGELGSDGVLIPWAWWVMALEKPQSTWVSRGFALWSFPDCFMEGLRTLIVPHVPSPLAAWTTRSGELEPIESICAGKRSVLLVVKAGSLTAQRERQVFGNLFEANARRDVEYIVVSIDGTQSDWETTMKGRSHRGEAIRWVGNDPRVFEAWGVTSVPQVVILGPDLDPLPGTHKLPSEGLGAVIERWPR